MKSSFGWVAINIAAMVTDLLAQRAPLVRRHALPLLTTLGVALLPTLLAALLLIALDLFAALLLTLGAPLFDVAPTSLASLRSLCTLAPLACMATWPAMARLRPHRLRGSEQTQAKNQDGAFHDGQLTAWRNRS